MAVVVSGGGARGPYEAGVLSVLLPALERTGRPNIYLGTSAGAINAVAFASMSDLGALRASEEVLEMWRDVRWSSVFRSPLAALLSRSRPRGAGPRRATAVLDTSPLARSLGTIIDWDRLHANVGEGRVTVGVVATAWSTRRTVVFLERAPGVRWPSDDQGRAISYVGTTLTPRHVLASSALPVAFPAVHIDRPSVAADWYIDGGVRMNTPLKPALQLGAKQLVVVATDPAEPAARRPVTPADWAPTAAGGAAQLFYGMLADRMVEDVRTLARRNAEATPDGQEGDDVIRWLFAGPEPGAFGPLAQLAGQVLQGLAPTQRRQGPVVELLRRTAGRWVARDLDRLEVLTHLLFDPDFIKGSIALGQRDARRSLDGLGSPAWRLTLPEPLEPAPSRAGAAAG